MELGKPMIKYVAWSKDGKRGSLSVSDDPRLLSSPQQVQGVPLLTMPEIDYLRRRHLLYRL